MYEHKKHLLSRVWKHVNDVKVSVDRIVVPDERARARYTEEQRDYLRASLGRYGQLSEILVRPLEGGQYELIDGESRLQQAYDHHRTKWHGLHSCG